MKYIKKFESVEINENFLDLIEDGYDSDDDSDDDSDESHVNTNMKKNNKLFRYRRC